MHGDYIIKSGYHLATKEEVKTNLNLNKLDFRTSQSNPVYYCGGYLKTKKDFVDQIDFTNAPF